MLKAAAANLDAVANAKVLTYDSVIRPLQLAPNYKTNPLLCQSKFLQHCSTDAALRQAAEEAGKVRHNCSYVKTREIERGNISLFSLFCCPVWYFHHLVVVGGRAEGRSESPTDDPPTSRRR